MSDLLDAELLERAGAGALPPTVGNLYVPGSFGPARIRAGPASGITITMSPNCTSLAV